jgi:CRISPR-associated protein Cas5
MTTKIDLSLLFQPPEPTVRLALYLQPLAALSMVSSMPGNYYRSERKPSKYMIYGVLENLLGWQLPKEMRMEILEKVYALWKKKGQPLPSQEKSEVEYLPLLQHHVWVGEQKLQPAVKVYVDYWTQHQKGADVRHLNGVRNEDWRLSGSIRQLRKAAKANKEAEEEETGEKESKKAGPDLLDQLFKDYKEHFPNYYSSPTPREFLIVEGFYVFELQTTAGLADLLLSATEALEAPLYLGTNEGWIDLKLKRV